VTGWKVVSFDDSFGILSAEDGSGVFDFSRFGPTRVLVERRGYEQTRQEGEKFRREIKNAEGVGLVKLMNAAIMFFDKRVDKEVEAPQRVQGLPLPHEVVPFGRFKGTPWGELPDYYVQWLATQHNEKTYREQGRRLCEARGIVVPHPAQPHQKMLF